MNNIDALAARILARIKELEEEIVLNNRTVVNQNKISKNNITSYKKVMHTKGKSSQIKQEIKFLTKLLDATIYGY